MPSLGLTAFVTLLVILDPLGLLPLFIALTGSRSAAERRRLAWLAASVAGGLILFFALLGGIILDYLKVSVDALAVAGGIYLFLLALEMLRGHWDHDDDAGQPPTDRRIALVPLATPLMAGPGAIGATLVLLSQAPDRASWLAVLIGIGGAVLLTGIVLRLGSRLADHLSPTIVALMTRVMGLLLAAVSVQLVFDGTRGWWG